MFRKEMTGKMSGMHIMINWPLIIHKIMARCLKIMLFPLWNPVRKAMIVYRRINVRIGEVMAMTALNLK